MGGDGTSKTTEGCVVPGQHAFLTTPEDAGRAVHHPCCGVFDFWGKSAQFLYRFASRFEVLQEKKHLQMDTDV